MNFKAVRRWPHALLCARCRLRRPSPKPKKQAEPEAPVGDCRFDKADHTIHGVTLGDYKTGKAILGDRMAKDGKKWRRVDRKDGDFPGICSPRRTASRSRHFGFIRPTS